MPLWHPLLAATPTGGPSTIRRPFGVNVRSTPHVLQIVDGTWDSLSTSLFLPINGQLSAINDTVSDNSPIKWLTLAFLRNVNVDVSDNTFSEDVDFVLIKNGVLVQTFFTIPAGAAGEGQYRRIGFTPFQNDDIVSYGFVTSSPPTGEIIMTCTAEIQYGQGAVTDLRGDEKRIVIAAPVVSIGGLENYPGSRIFPQGSFQSPSSSGNENENKVWTAYREMFTGEWIFQQTRQTGNKPNMQISFHINGALRFTIAVADNDFTVHVVKLVEETFPGSGIFVPIKLEIGDTIEYRVSGWLGFPTLPRRDFMNVFWVDLL